MAKGIGIEVDENKLGKYHELYLSHGQFQPYDPSLIGTDLFRQPLTRCSRMHRAFSGMRGAATQFASASNPGESSASKRRSS